MQLPATLDLSAPGTYPVSFPLISCQKILVMLISHKPLRTSITNTMAFPVPQRQIETLIYKQQIHAFPFHQRRLLAQMRFHVSPSRLIKLFRSSQTKRPATNGGFDLSQGTYGCLIMDTKEGILVSTGTRPADGPPSVRAAPLVPNYIMDWLLHRY